MQSKTLLEGEPGPSIRHEVGQAQQAQTSRPVRACRSSPDALLRDRKLKPCVSGAPRWERPGRSAACRRRWSNRLPSRPAPSQSKRWESVQRGVGQACVWQMLQGGSAARLCGDAHWSRRHQNLNLRCTPCSRAGAEVAVWHFFL